MPEPVYTEEELTEDIITEIIIRGGYCPEKWDSLTLQVAAALTPVEVPS